MEPALKKLIHTCELSAQTLFIHGRNELISQTSRTMLMPKQIASKDAAKTV